MPYLYDVLDGDSSSPYESSPDPRHLRLFLPLPRVPRPSDVASTRVAPRSYPPYPRAWTSTPATRTTRVDSRKTFVPRSSSIRSGRRSALSRYKSVQNRRTSSSFLSQPPTATDAGCPGSVRRGRRVCFTLGPEGRRLPPTRILPRRAGHSCGQVPVGLLPSGLRLCTHLDVSPPLVPKVEVVQRRRVGVKEEYHRVPGYHQEVQRVTPPVPVHLLPGESWARQVVESFCVDPRHGHSGPRRWDRSGAVGVTGKGGWVGPGVWTKTIRSRRDPFRGRNLFSRGSTSVYWYRGTPRDGSRRRSTTTSAW